MDVSVIIPTRDRPDSLRRVLQCFAAQVEPANEIIIVDASATSADSQVLTGQFPTLPIRLLHTVPALCAQRNAGIAAASGDLIFLCDDDVEFAPTYLRSLIKYLADHPAEGAVTGEVLEPDPAGTFVRARSGGSAAWLLWSFLFQLTVWRDLTEIGTIWWTRPVVALLRRFYRARGNTVTLAGWPLLTSMPLPVYSTMIYGLGASVIRRTWLSGAPFDQTLHPSGIGDNYGVALGFPGRTPVTVLPGERVFHHRHMSGRLAPDLVFSLRAFALDYFMARSDRFSTFHRLLLRWSMLGYCMYYAFARNHQMFTAAVQTLGKLLRGRNPYILTITRHPDHG
jgi:glycosyltransferase involved in cell wall biosynthesis